MADTIAKMKNNSIVANIGHFDNEVYMACLMKMCTRQNIKPQVDRYEFTDGHGVIVLAEGRLEALDQPEPQRIHLRVAVPPLRRERGRSSGRIVATRPHTTGRAAGAPWQRVTLAVTAVAPLQWGRSCRSCGGRSSTARSSSSPTPPSARRSHEACHRGLA